MKEIERVPLALVSFPREERIKLETVKYQAS